MLTLNNVLVATDFSEPSATALLYGRELAGRFGATLHVLHVAQNIYIGALAADNYAGIAPDLQQQIEDDARLQLHQLLVDTDKSGPPSIPVTSDIDLACYGHRRVRQGPRHRHDRHGHARPRNACASRHGQCGRNAWSGWRHAPCSPFGTPSVNLSRQTRSQPSAGHLDERWRQRNAHLSIPRVGLDDRLRFGLRFVVGVCTQVRLITEP